MNDPLSSIIKDKLVKQMQRESNLVRSRMILTTATTKCFAMCVPEPGSRLSAGEQKCINQCSEKFLATWNQVSAAVMLKLEKEKGNAHALALESRDPNLSESSF